jgi:hypothetical protein
VRLRVLRAVHSLAASALPLVFLLTTSLLLAACGDEPSTRVPDPSPPPAAPDASPSPDGDEGAGEDEGDPQTPRFVSAEQCGRCHTEIYEEWKASYHGLAMSDRLFLELAPENKDECIRCHAPVPIREVDFETPVARAERREDAISCLTCHQSGGNVTGPFPGLQGACRPIHDEDQRNVVKMCFGCHNQHDTGTEWLDGPYGPRAREPRVREEKSCLDCHMPRVDRPLVKGGPVRAGRRHTWPGGHDLSHVRKAATLEVEVEALPSGGRRFRTWVTNVGAGHSIPTDARHRSFDLYVKVWDADGKVLLDPLDPRQQERSRSATYRKFYRNSGRKDTQIAPLQRASAMPDERGYVDVPEAVAGGRGEAWLVYRLTPKDVLIADSLVDGPLVLYQARLVTRTEFTFGP